MDLLAEVSRQWDMAFVSLRPEISLAGSPERSVWRSVLETRDSQLFVLEKIPSRVYDRKRRIIRTLEALHNRKMPHVPRYLRDSDGEFIPLIDHGLWQLCPFVAGVELNRPAYALDEWRGEAAAAFLTRLHRTCSPDCMDFVTPPFSIADYSRALYTTLYREASTVAACYRPFMDHLEEHLFPLHHRLPNHFCHGDFHPLNIIWGAESIKAVVDWEFCGSKPEAYDLANLLGCLGMEDPQSLNGPFVHRLVGRLKRSGIFCDESWNTLPDLVLAIRFAWLSEWMRKKDQSMVQLEADYMSLLLTVRSELIAVWGPP